MKQYELTVLIHPDLEMNLQPATDKVEALIESVGGKIVKETNEGKKRMQYKIAKQEFAVYYYYEVELPADAPAKIEKQLKITDEIIRSLIVKKDARKEKMEARRKKREEENVEENEETVTEEEK